MVKRQENVEVETEWPIQKPGMVLRKKLSPLTKWLIKVNYGFRIAWGTNLNLGMGKMLENSNKLMISKENNSSLINQRKDNALSSNAMISRWLFFFPEARNL